VINNDNYSINKLTECNSHTVSSLLCYSITVINNERTSTMFYDICILRYSWRLFQMAGPEHLKA